MPVHGRRPHGFRGINPLDFAVGVANVQPPEYTTYKITDIRTLQCQFFGTMSILGLSFPLAFDGSLIPKYYALVFSFMAINNV